ncbi:hypothetical protein V5799_007466 [Amblyomma americanum]|uniref:Secreted protein n=1 Tax=Amblyomma americanum TaxID=6943 RepID=A0AAQ4FG02_AMBAM
MHFAACMYLVYGHPWLTLLWLCLGVQPPAGEEAKLSAEDEVYRLHSGDLSCFTASINAASEGAQAAGEQLGDLFGYGSDFAKGLQAEGQDSPVLLSIKDDELSDGSKEVARIKWDNEESYKLLDSIMEADASEKLAECVSDDMMATGGTNDMEGRYPHSAERRYICASKTLCKQSAGAEVLSIVCSTVHAPTLQQTTQRGSSCKPAWKAPHAASSRTSRPAPKHHPNDFRPYSWIALIHASHWYHDCSASSAMLCACFSSCVAMQDLSGVWGLKDGNVIWG